MQIHEREQLNRFLEQLSQAGPVATDPEAERLIAEACARQPHAAYLLVQRALLLEQALQDNRRQVEQLRAELDAARRPSGGFLDNGAWGNGGWGNRPAPAVSGPSAAAASVPVASAPVQAAPAAGSGWLGTVATTAAGVVAGSFLFQGIEHLIGGSHAGSAGLLGNDPLSRGMSENTTINNYYESAPEPARSDNAFDDTAFGDLTDIGSDDWV